MNMPEGEAPAGWYEVPGERNSERYWDGKNWTSETRRLEWVPTATDSNGTVRTLGRFFFRNPITSDWAFIAYVVVVGLTMFTAVKQDYDNGFSFPVILQIPVLALLGVWVYILFLLILIPRRFMDKRRGVLFPTAKVESIESPAPGKKSYKAVYIVGGIGAFFLILAMTSLNNSGKSDGDKYFEIEQEISAVVKDWNVAATPISEAIRSISDGTMSAAEGRQIAGEASTQFAIINNRLDDACSLIPEYDLNADGREGAFAKSYDALQVTCDLLPQESTEILLLVGEQVSLDGTQAKIDYHVNEIAIIIEKRKKAIIDSIDALMPYLSDAQKDNIERLRTVLNN
jgi:hypothetical protein